MHLNPSSVELRRSSSLCFWFKFPDFSHWFRVCSFLTAMFPNYQGNQQPYYPNIQPGFYPQPQPQFGYGPSAPATSGQYPTPLGAVPPQSYTPQPLGTQQQMPQQQGQLFNPMFGFPQGQFQPSQFQQPIGYPNSGAQSTSNNAVSPDRMNRPSPQTRVVSQVKS